MTVDIFTIQCAINGLEAMKQYHEGVAETNDYLKDTELARADGVQFAIDMLEALIPELKNVPSEASATSVAR